MAGVPLSLGCSDKESQSLCPQAVHQAWSNRSHVWWQSSVQRGQQCLALWPSLVKHVLWELGWIRDSRGPPGSEGTWP